MECPNTPTRRSVRLMLLTLVALPLLAGCLEEPEIDERWTLLEMLSSDPRPGERLDAGQPLAVSLSSRITYRAIRTGFLVAEVRYSDTLGPAAVGLDPERHNLATARQVERILDNSVTAGRGTRAVTGFDQLMQTVNFDFTATVPPELFGGGPDSLASRGLYLLLYLAEGDEMELASGRDSLVVTPLPVDEYELLFTGFALDVTAPAGGAP